MSRFFDRRCRLHDEHLDPDTALCDHCARDARLDAAGAVPLTGTASSMVGEHTARKGRTPGAVSGKSGSTGVHNRLKGAARTMTHHTQPQTQPVAHRALCPACGRLAERETHKQSITGIATSLFACPKAHLWQTQWAEVA